MRSARRGFRRERAVIQNNRRHKHGPKHGPFLLIQLDLLRHPRFNALKFSGQRIYLELLAEASYQNQKGPPKSGDRVEESYSLIRKNTGASSATIASALKTLEADGFIKKLNDPGPGAWINGEDATGEFEINLDWIKNTGDPK